VTLSIPSFFTGGTLDLPLGSKETLPFSFLGYLSKNYFYLLVLAYSTSRYKTFDLLLRAFHAVRISDSLKGLRISDICVSSETGLHPLLCHMYRALIIFFQLMGFYLMDTNRPSNQSSRPNVTSTLSKLRVSRDKSMP
jgi:hypothetical protein